MKTRHLIVAAAFSAAFLGLADAAGAGPLFFEGDMVRGRSQDGQTGVTCVLTSQYMRKEHVVWRVRVLDAAGGQVDDKGLKSLEVVLSSGEKFAMKFGPHPRGKPTDNFWATSWGIPVDYPTGTISYKIVATDMDGHAHEWMPFNVNLSNLTIIPGEAVFTK